MALRSAAVPNIWNLFAPQLSSATVAAQFRPLSLFSPRLHASAPFLFSVTLPSAIQLKIPSLLSDIWESILRAVPKKKTSHRKKRQRFMAGKALKDVTELNKCSACGNVKRAHLLCPYCVREIKDMWLGKSKKSVDVD